MTTVEPDEQGKTARIEQVPPASPPPAPPAGIPLPDPAHAFETEPFHVEAPASVVARRGGPQQQDVVFVPMAVNVGDGFKFGCGFFLALILAMLIGFVLVAALFVLTSLFGLNLPITR